MSVLSSTSAAGDRSLSAATATATAAGTGTTTGTNTATSNDGTASNAGPAMSGPGASPEVIQGPSLGDNEASKTAVAGSQPVKKVLSVAQLFMQQNVDLSHITNEEFRALVGKILSPRPAKQHRKHFVLINGALRGDIPEYGDEDELAQQVCVALGRGIANSQWFVSLKACLAFHNLLWDGGASIAEAARRLTPMPNADTVPDFSANMCGQGIKQRPVVAFIAGMINFLLRSTALVSLQEVRTIAKRGIHVPRQKPTDSSPGLSVTNAAPVRSDAPADLLLRCVTLVSYLNYLLSAVDLPLLAMDNELSVSALDAIVHDLKKVYAFVWQHLVTMIDLKYHRIYDVEDRDLGDWNTMFTSFRTAGNRLTALFTQLRGLQLDLSEHIPTLEPFPKDASDKLERIVRERHAPAKHIPTSAEAPRNQRPAARAPAAGGSKSVLKGGETRDGSETPRPQSEGKSPLSKRSDQKEEYSDESAHAHPSVQPFAVRSDSSKDNIRETTLTTETDSDDRRENNFVLNSFDAAVTERFILGDVIGRGAYGTVVKAFDTEQGQFVAVKELKVGKQECASWDAQIAELEREFKVLEQTHHSNVVAVLKLDRHAGEHPRIIMEWMPGGSVSNALRLTRKGFKESVVARYIKQAMQGLTFLHANGIVHRDLKPANMLLSASGEVKISDFGTSRFVAEMESMQTGTVVGTIPYLAPECLKGTYSQGSDVWAMGCSALEMMTGQMPWAEKKTRDSFALIFIIGNSQPPDHHPQLPDSTPETQESPLVPSASGGEAGLACGVGTISENARNFLLACFTYDYKERPSAAELLQHPFLANI